jgi:hypothetical protein
MYHCFLQLWAKLALSSFTGGHLSKRDVHGQGISDLFQEVLGVCVVTNFESSADTQVCLCGGDDCPFWRGLQLDGFEEIDATQL